MRPWLLLPVALLTAGCLGLRRAEPPPPLGGFVLEGVPRLAFGTDRCGSGALASVLAFHGDPVTQAALEATLPRAANTGVLSVDLLLAARGRRYPARLAPGSFEALAAALRSGIPPVLLLRVADLPGRRKDLFHYVVADGVDESRELVRVLLGDGRERWIGRARLERAWRGGGHAMLLVPPRGAPLGDALAAAVALEREGDLEGAAGAYAALVDSGAATALVWTNLGNVATARGRIQEAEQAYERALALAPDDPDALANLAWLRLQQGRAEEAEDLAARAAVGPGRARGPALDTVGRARMARGRCAEAAVAFRASLDALMPGDPAREGAAGGLADATACAAAR